MLLSADSLMIIFVKIYCYWTRTVGVIAKGSRGPVFFERQCSLLIAVAIMIFSVYCFGWVSLMWISEHLTVQTYRLWLTKG